MYVLNMVILHSYAALTNHVSLGLRKPSRMNHVNPCNNTRLRNWMEGYQLLPTMTGWWYTYPSEKWWSSSVGMIGMMTFPIYWKS